jgi:hypothetical protein
VAIGYDLGQGLAGLGDWFSRLRNQSAPVSPAARYLPPQEDPAGDAFGEFGRSFTAGAVGAPDPAIQGQLSALKNMGQPVAPPAPAPADTASLGSAMFGEPSERPDANGFNAEAAAAALSRGTQRREAMSPGRVNVTVNGKSYEYGGGQAGGAPTLGGIGDKLGEQWSNVVSDQTREFSQPGLGNGSFSQLTELDPSMKTIGQLQDERALADARPTGDPLGYTRGDMRGLDTTLQTKMADEQARGAAQVGVARAKSLIEQADEKRVMDNLALLDNDDYAETEQMRSDPRFRSASLEQQAEMLAKLKLAQDARSDKSKRYRENLALARGKVNTTYRPGDPLSGS